ncbi:sodium:alanine symporter family protein [Algivirga pacifica]
METLNEILGTIDGYIGGSNWFVFALLGTGLFFTLFLKFPQLRYFKHALKIVSGKYDKADDEGDTSHFQALATALSGTVGTGNIAGVAYAIYLGGPAALFWMIFTAFLGMTTKFVEVTLSHKYREKTDDGTMAGGPMYYMKNAEFKIFGKNKAMGKKIMAGMAAVFAFATVLSSFGTGSLPQIKSIADSVHATFGIEHMHTGAVLAVLLGFVIIGGIQRIAKITEKLVPGMALIYLIGALSVIFYNIDNVIPSLVDVFAHVFTGTAAVGGFLGAGFAYAFNRGVNRGLFSNEAGQGSAPIAHASAKAHEPVSEGMVAILEPFIDTIVICTITGLTILSSGVWNEKFENTFQFSEVSIMAQQYEDSQEDRLKLGDHLSEKHEEPMFSGLLNVQDGNITNTLTILHARSIAEDITVYLEQEDGSQVPYTGKVIVEDGTLKPGEQAIVMQGKSLLHSSPLTAEAFKRSFFGDYGQYIISIGLLLFAFSTAISWSYYGDRAITYLFGAKGILPFRIVYVVAFFFASFADTTVIWTLSGITIALMTIPNLIGILLLHKEMKETVDNYWSDFEQEWPEEKKRKLSKEKA